MSLGLLQKMKLKAYSDAAFESEIAGKEFTVQVNPETYTVNHTIQYNEAGAQGNSAPQLRFNRTSPQDLDFEFIFDGTGVIPPNGIPTGNPLPIPVPKMDVVGELNKLKDVVFNYNGDIHEPNYVKIYWGTLLLNCRLKTLSIVYKLFKPDGTPLRAVAKCTFTGTVQDNVRTATEGANSPDLTHIRTVKEGDSLPLMCHRIYKDEKLYLEVARANKLTNFRQLKTGQQLYFPPIDKAAKSK
ncbi:MAG: LysM peptidoglycan-binding domain-containing protein [Chitinophagaceae bacterium]